MKCPEGKYFCNDRQKCMPIPKGTRVRKDGKLVKEAAVSKKQQRFFGMVRAAQKGEMKNPSPEVSKVADDISKKDAKKFAKTKHKGLPEKKKINEGEYGKLKGYEKSILQGGLKVRSGDPLSYDREMRRLVKMYPGFKVEEVSRKRKPSAIKKKKKLEKLLIDKEVKEIQQETYATYQQMIDAGWEMTGEGIWWPPQQETVSEKMTFKSFRGVLDRKKKQEKKPEKAMDAGAKARRKLKRKEHAKYVSGSEDNVPDDIRDHKEYTE